MKAFFTKAWNWIQYTWKAVDAGLYAAVAYLYAQGVVNTSLSPIDALGDSLSTIGGWSVGQWMAFVGVIAGAYGVTFFARNKELPEG